ncbi:MAG TPA: NnrU family protein [Candidatus Limnocylindrales bacterium]|nr:NnrU family protein [Candidatus Limnocylindrales bacterium]
MKRVAVGAYAGFAYLLFLTAIVWAVLFLADLGGLKTIDSGRGSPGSGAPALAVDGGLLGLFALQHSLMARRSFKRAFTQLVPAPLERSTYVLLASAILLCLVWQWRPMPAVVWHLRWAPAAAALTAVSVLGWLIVVSSTFMINHFDLFGLRQAYLFIRSQAYRPVDFKERWLYALVRHPMMLGLVIAFWATPTMSAGHLLFATASTAYIGLGTMLEERDLRQSLGATYLDYAKRIPAFIPRPGQPGRPGASRGLGWQLGSSTED